MEDFCFLWQLQQQHITTINTIIKTKATIPMSAPATIPPRLTLSPSLSSGGDPTDNLLSYRVHS